MNDNAEKRIGRGPYVVGGLSFIPLIGVIFGVIAIILGVVNFKRGGKNLIFIGIGGILFTIILYGGLFYFGFIKKGGVFDELKYKVAKHQLTTLVETIEFHKLMNGKYPESLEALAKSMPKDKPLFVHDPTQFNTFDKTKASYFYYELLDDGKTYYLLGVGPDKKPFTADDLLPEVDMSKLKNIGLRIHPGSIKK